MSVGRCGIVCVFSDCRKNNRIRKTERNKKKSSKINRKKVPKIGKKTNLCSYYLLKEDN